MTSAVWIQPDPLLSPSIIEVDELADYQSLVDGWVEALQVPSHGITILVNEGGRLRRLKFNARVSPALVAPNASRPLPDDLRRRPDRRST